MSFLIVFFATFVTAILSLSGGYLFLYNNKLSKVLRKTGPYIAIVVLLYAIFGDLIPEILEDSEIMTINVVLLIILGFILCLTVGFVMGHFHHHSDPHSESKEDKVKLKNRSDAYTMLVVDSIHTVSDGIMLGVTFATGNFVGLMTCLSVVAHEIPQEIGDFAIMDRSKMKKREIVKLETYSGLILVPAALIAYLLGNIFEKQLPIILCLVCGSLLYIAFSELVIIIEDIREKMPHQLK